MLLELSSEHHLVWGLSTMFLGIKRYSNQGPTREREIPPSVYNRGYLMQGTGGTAGEISSQAGLGEITHG